MICSIIATFSNLKGTIVGNLRHILLLFNYMYILITFVEKTPYSFPLLPAEQLVQDLYVIADLHLEEKDFKQPSVSLYEMISLTQHSK
jgi:hypothetical protein